MSMSLTQMLCHCLPHTDSGKPCYLHACEVGMQMAEFADDKTEAEFSLTVPLLEMKAHVHRKSMSANVCSTVIYDSPKLEAI